MAQARQRALVAGATLGATAVLAANAEAATYVVNSVSDTGTGTCNPSPGACTLRDAVTTANTTGEPDIVDLSAVSGTILLDPAKGVIFIDDPGGLSIDGPGEDTLTVSGGGATGIFEIEPGTATVAISGLTLTGGSAPDGAAIFTSSSLTLTNVTVTGNHAADNGGGIAAVDSKYDINVDIENSTISGNTADGAGGGILAFGGSLSLTGSTVSGNTADGGGGIHSRTKYGTTIDSSIISINTARYGGGLAVFGDSSDSPGDNPVVVESSTISGNQAPNGAGIEIGYDDGGSTPVTVTASTISGNQGGSGSHGGGIQIVGTRDSAFDLVNSTISGNSAANGGGVSLGYANSGAAVLGPDGSISFDNSTIAANTAAGSGGGIYLAQYDAGSGNQSVTAALDSTIVADNTAGGAPNDLFRPATSTSGGVTNAFSLIENPGNAPLLGSQALITGVDPQLGALADNGGPTRTMLPSSTSPAIDQGRAQTGLTTDQRGELRTIDNGKPRPAGGDGTDIGAVERPLIPPPPPPPPPPSPPVVPKPPVVVTTECKSNRNFTIRLIERRGRQIRSARVFVRGRRVAVVRRRSDRRLVAVVDLRGLPKGTYRVVIRARLRNGDRARWVRSYRTCLDRVLPPSNDLDDPRAL